MAITSTQLLSHEEYAPGCHKLEMEHGMFVLYKVQDPRRITIRRHERKRGHWYRLDQVPAVEDLGEAILNEVNYLLAEGMLPYARKRRKPSRPRDVQKARLYDAERSCVAWGTGALPQLIDVQTYVSRLVQSAWWKQRFPEVTYIDVRNSRANRGYARSKKRTIHMPPFTRHHMYILHEVAHIVSDVGDWESRMAHGPEYARCYLDIVEHALGPEVAESLRLGMRDFGVRYA